MNEVCVLSLVLGRLWITLRSFSTTFYGVLANVAQATFKTKCSPGDIELTRDMTSQYLIAEFIGNKMTGIGAPIYVMIFKYYSIVLRCNALDHCVILYTQKLFFAITNVLMHR